jgi:cytochrome c
MKKTILVSILILAVFAVFSAAVAGGDVQKGRALFNSTTLGTNGKSCASCHPQGSRINGQKSSFTIMGHKLNSVEDAANFCIRMALKGKPLKKDSPEMKALAEYLKTLKGKKKNRRRIIKGC